MEHADRLEWTGERRQRRLQDGRAFQIVKRYWHPPELEAELAAIGWHAVVRNTPWAFIYGTATRVQQHHASGSEAAPPSGRRR